MVIIMKSQKQSGTMDCRVFSVAYTIAIAIPVKQRFGQEAVKAHTSIFIHDKTPLYSIVLVFSVAKWHLYMHSINVKF